jgi:hypothetical protein
MSTQHPDDQPVTITDLPADQPADQMADQSTAEMSEEEAQAQAVFQALAASIGFLPQDGISEGEAPPEGAIAIPVIEQDGTQYVPVFTSEEALRAAGADTESAVGLPLAELAANWPSDELWLAVNPGSEDGLTLPPDAVRVLGTFTTG